MLKFIFILGAWGGGWATASTQLIVWNVGQGQWITKITQEYCFHFDMGGEISPLARVTTICRDRFNWIQLSHWDLDHVSFLSAFQKRIPRKCLIPPDTPAPTAHKKRLAQGIPLCTSAELQAWHEKASILHRPSVTAKGNQASTVIFLRSFSLLIPGDSPLKDERHWLHLAPNRTRGLLLGHHGSRTSTSLELLRQMPGLQWAVASARSGRYGHPHPEIRRRLQKNRIPLLRTEDWGHLHFLKNEK
jgi:competence protein ComEC